MLRSMSMRLTLVLALLVAAGCASAEAGKAKKPAPAEGTEVGKRVPAFETTGKVFDTDGKPTAVTISSRKLARPTAYVFVGTHCPTTAMYLGRLAALEQQYAKKVDWVFLYPNKTDSLDEKTGFHKGHKLAGPLVDDQGAKLATLLGAERTAEVVLAGKDGVIVYRGAIDDNKDETNVKRKHLAVAIDEHLAGKPVSEPKTQVFA
jgi:hypothetical protein